MSSTTTLQPHPVSVTKQTTRETFPVLEMTCAACAVSVESMLKSKEGVLKAEVNFANQTALVEYNPGEVSRTGLQTTVRSIGYDLVIDTENEAEILSASDSNRYQQLKKATIWSAILSLPVVIIGMWFMDMPFANWIMMALSAPVLFILGKSYFINALKQAKHRKANMDTLVALSTSVAFIFSAFNTIYPAFWHERGLHPHVYFEAASVIIVFISLGKLLEEKARAGTTSALKKLIGLQPQTVTVVNADGDLADVPFSAVSVGDVILVKPGEKIAVDGKVISGNSYVDESMISGESLPVLKNTNDKVYAGTINQKGSLRFAALKVGADTVLGQIIRMVQEAQGSKAPVQRLVDRIAGIFVPVVIVVAILTFIAWMLFGNENALTHGLLSATSVLVIACPCALGLATPTAIMVGVGKGAENNILIRDAASLEAGYKVNVVVLDKTGTITEGKPTVTDVMIFDASRRMDVLAILSSLESHSEHPLAEAVVNHLHEQRLLPVSLSNIESLTGRGIIGRHQSHRYAAGNLNLMNELGVSVSASVMADLNRLQQQSATVILFAEDETLLGLLAITDQIKQNSSAAIQDLKDMGMRVLMLTGDNQHTAAAVATAAGIDEYHAEMMPADKAQFIKSLTSNGDVVAMIGDGINDSQALAEADLSIAMGGGSDIAIDVAKITLTTSDLKGVPRALRLSAKTFRTLNQNLFWAFIYNLIGIPIAAGILYPFNGFLLNPMIAGAAMALSSVSVVANSLRLKMAKL